MLQFQIYNDVFQGKCVRSKVQAQQSDEETQTSIDPSNYRTGVCANVDASGLIARLIPVINDSK